MSETSKQPELIISATALAAALGRSRSALYANWFNHPQWTFAKSPPWPASEVPAMEQWALDWLRDNGAEIRNETRDNSDGFYDRWQWPYHVPVAIPTKGHLDPVADEQTYPELFASPFEKDLIAGRRKMSPAELKKYIKAQIHCRVVLAEKLTGWLPEWLTKLPESEVACRVRAALYEEFQNCGGWCEMLADDQDGIERDGDGNIVKPATKKQSPRKETPCTDQ